MKKAFTLIELLVGISIFSLIVSGITGSFVAALRAQRRAIALREIIDSASYALEYMAAALRMAKKDGIEIKGGSPKNCWGPEELNYEIGLNEIKFRNYEDKCQRFFLEAGRLKEEREGFPQHYYLTPDDLEITRLGFEKRGDTPGDNLQPRVTILLEIQKRGLPESKIIVQTTISQRDLDL